MTFLVTDHTNFKIFPPFFTTFVHFLVLVLYSVRRIITQRGKEEFIQLGNLMVAVVGEEMLVDKDSPIINFR